MVDYSLIDINIKILPWATARQYAEPIRRTVFIKEQCVPEDMEWDELDENAIHAIAFDKTGQALGYARLLTTKQLGRMAVYGEYRRKGIGSALLGVLEEEARKIHYDHIFLHAQIQALPFYEKHGYQSQATPFDEAGIPHLMMTKTLTAKYE
jgi:predicted GNAT family N-acyltransferase